ncbi:hypothetical protein [Pseudoalteromonas phenolica]|uniref:hypothetical protein n=1 Tax=Pseudoalteromonas phenolica TaxID=161398 RepID=UPI00110A2DB3|nr:hypothetical protein [Pseudoalteromonas phenolica]TMO57109.1 hypothetical protein CWC21_04280 [Pseudoalteromonas phenolica]
MTLYYLNFLIPIVLAISLLLSWKDVNARFMILSYAFVEVISLSTYGWAKGMQVGFYLWSMGISIVFLICVFGRRYWAFHLSSIKFFSEAYEQHRYSIQETALVLLFLLCAAVNLITFIEVYAYTEYWIDNLFIKENVRDFVQSSVNILAALICLSFVVKSSNRNVSASQIAN